VCEDFEMQASESRGGMDHKRQELATKHNLQASQALVETSELAGDHWHGCH
jgi:hypothetical protein